MVNQVGKIVEKVVTGKMECSALEKLTAFSEFSKNDASAEEFFGEESFKYAKTFGKEALANPVDFVQRLRIALRCELARRHNLIETFRVFEALKALKMSVIRVSKGALNYDNVKIVRRFSKVATSEDARRELLEALCLIEKIKRV